MRVVASRLRALEDPPMLTGNTRPLVVRNLVLIWIAQIARRGIAHFVYLDLIPFAVIDKDNARALIGSHYRPSDCLSQFGERFDGPNNVSVIVPILLGVDVQNIFAHFMP